MAVIPLKQKMFIIRPAELDDYGEPIGEPERIEKRCRFVEKTQLVKRYSSGIGANQTMSAEVVSSAQIFLDKFADIRFTDEIEYTDENNITKTYSVLDIAPKRNFGGKAILTVVYV